MASAHFYFVWLFLFFCWRICGFDTYNYTAKTEKSQIFLKLQNRIIAGNFEFRNRLNLQTIKEIVLPLGHLPLIFFGGVTAENLKQVLATGVAGVGMASAILNKDAIAKRDHGTITQLAKNITHQM